jgi:predicted dehydrogenase
MHYTGIALIGCGGISRVHLEAISRESRAKLITTVDSNLARAEEAARLYGASSALDSWEHALDLDDVDAAIICLPHHLHTPATIYALEKGKHVLLEKPISTSIDDANRMISTAEKNDRILMVGHMKRFNHAFSAMKRNIEDGNIGDPSSFQATWYGPREIIPSVPWVMEKQKGGGGPLIGFGTHHFDLLHWLLGRVESVACFVQPTTIPGSDIEDTAVVCLKMIDGPIGVVNFTWYRTVVNFFEEISVIGRNGEITSRDGEVHLASEPRFEDRNLHLLDPNEEIGDISKSEFSGELSHFLDCIELGVRPINDGNSARDALSVVLAAYRSAERGEIVKVEYGEAGTCQ